MIRRSISLISLFVLSAACSTNGFSEPDAGSIFDASSDGGLALTPAATRMDVETRFRVYDYALGGEFPAISPGLYQDVQLKVVDYEGAECGVGCTEETCGCSSSFGGDSLYGQYQKNEAMVYEIKSLRLSGDVPYGSYKVKVRYYRDCALSARENRDLCLRHVPTTSETVITLRDSSGSVISRRKFCHRFEAASDQWRTVYDVLYTDYSGFTYFGYLMGYESIEIDQTQACW